jgi:hypothetical protein
MKPILCTAVFLPVFMATTVSAGVAGWTEPASVITLEANDLARFVVRLDVDKNASGCRDPNWFYADYGRSGSALMYQTLLEAFLHERKVRLYVTGVCDLKGYSGISAARIQR